MFTQIIHLNIKKNKGQLVKMIRKIKFKAKKFPHGLQFNQISLGGGVGGKKNFCSFFTLAVFNLDKGKFLQNFTCSYPNFNKFLKFITKILYPLMQNTPCGNFLHKVIVL